MIRERGEVKRKNKIIQPNATQINNEFWHASDLGYTNGLGVAYDISWAKNKQILKSI
jgi:hypothetical protein